MFTSKVQALALKLLKIKSLQVLILASYQPEDPNKTDLLVELPEPSIQHKDGDFQFQYKLMDKKKLLAPQLHASLLILMNKPPEFNKLHQGLQQEINKSPYGVFTELQTQEIKDPMGPDKSEIF